MAKKAKKAAMKEAPRSKPSGNKGLVIGVIVAVIVVIILVVLLRGRQAAPTGPATTGPVAPEAVSPKPVLTASTPEFTKYCKESTGTTAPTLGYSPCACKIEGNELKVSLINSGKEDIEGVYFEVKGKTKTIYFGDFNNVAPKEAHSYTLDLTEIAQQLGEKVTDMIAHPSQDKNACLNTRLAILSKESCVSACTGSQ